MIATFSRAAGLQDHAARAPPCSAFELVVGLVGAGFQDGAAQPVGFRMEEFELGEFLRVGFQQPGMMEDRAENQRLARGIALLEPRIERLVASRARAARTDRGVAEIPLLPAALPVAAAQSRLACTFPRSKLASREIAPRRAGANSARRRPEILAIISPHGLVADLTRRSRRCALRARRAVRVSRGRALGLAQPQHVGERARAASTSAMASRPPERVRSSGSWPSGSSANFRLLPAAVSAAPDRPHDRPRAAGLVAVETQDRLVGDSSRGARAAPPSAPCRAARRSRETRVDHGDHIDITFDRDDRRAVMRGLARGGAVVEMSPCGRAASPAS